MKKRYLVIPLVLIFAVILMLGAFPISAETGPAPQPSPPVGQIVFYGLDAADVLGQGHDFARDCNCYVYDGRLDTTRLEMAELTLNYTAGGQ